MRTARCVAVALLLPGPCLSLRIGDDDAAGAPLTLADSLSTHQHSKTATLLQNVRTSASPGEAAASTTEAPAAAEAALKKTEDAAKEKEGEALKKAADDATTTAAAPADAPSASQSQQPADDSAAIEEYLDGLLDKHKTAVVEVPQEPLVIVEPDAKDGYTARTLSDASAAGTTDGQQTGNAADQAARPKAAAFWLNTSTAAFANAQDLKDKLHKWISGAKDATVAELAPEVAAKASAADLVATLAAGNEGSSQQTQEAKDPGDIIAEEEAAREQEEKAKDPLEQAATSRQNAQFEERERQALGGCDWKEEMYGIWAFCAALGLSIGAVLCFDSMGKAFPHPLYGPEEALCLTAAARAQNRGGIDCDVQYDDVPPKSRPTIKEDEKQRSKKRYVEEEPVGRPSSREAEEVDQVLTVKQGKKSGFVSEVAQAFTFVASSGRGGKPQGGKGTR